MENKPRIAIGWILPDDGDGKFRIVGRDWNICRGVSISGQYSNPPLDHSRVWREIRVGLGLDIYPYEYFPRFRVVADMVDQAFEVWGDEKILHNEEWQKLIINKYFLPEEGTKFFTDGLHYFSANPDSQLVWDAEAGEMKLIIESYDTMLKELKNGQSAAEEEA